MNEMKEAHECNALALNVINLNTKIILIARLNTFNGAYLYAAEERKIWYFKITDGRTK